jgi:hypothetical protein
MSHRSDAARNHNSRSILEAGPSRVRATATTIGAAIGEL